MNGGETTGLVWAEEPHGGVVCHLVAPEKRDAWDINANARLIAAAPEMLEALALVQAWFENPDKPHPSATAVRSSVNVAIAKAKGDSDGS